jgi:hypothetical protein
MKKKRVCKNCGESKYLCHFPLNTHRSKTFICKKCTKLLSKLTSIECKGCGVTKLLKDFGTHKSGRRRSKCKECITAKKKEKYEAIKRGKESQELPPEAKKLLLSREDMKRVLLAGRANIHERNFKI